MYTIKDEALRRIRLLMSNTNLPRANQQKDSLKDNSSTSKTVNRESRVGVDFLDANNSEPFICRQQVQNKIEEPVYFSETETSKPDPVEGGLYRSILKNTNSALDRKIDNRKLLLGKLENKPSQYFIVKNIPCGAISIDKHIKITTKNSPQKAAATGRCTPPKYALIRQADTGSNYILKKNKNNVTSCNEHNEITFVPQKSATSAKSYLKDDTVNMLKHLLETKQPVPCTIKTSQTTSTPSYSMKHIHGISQCIQDQRNIKCNHIEHPVVNASCQTVASRDIKKKERTPKKDRSSSEAIRSINTINRDSGARDGKIKTDHMNENTASSRIMVCDDVLCMEKYYGKKITPETNTDTSYHSYNRYSNIGMGISGSDQQNYAGQWNDKHTSQSLPLDLSMKCSEAETVIIPSTDEGTAGKCGSDTVSEYGKEKKEIGNLEFPIGCIVTVPDSSDTEPIFIKAVFANERTCVPQNSGGCVQVHSEQAHTQGPPKKKFKSQTSSRDMLTTQQNSICEKTQCGYCFKAFTSLSELCRHSMESHTMRNADIKLSNQQKTSKKEQAQQSDVFHNQRQVSKNLDTVAKFTATRKANPPQKNKAKQSKQNKTNQSKKNKANQSVNVPGKAVKQCAGQSQEEHKALITHGPRNIQYNSHLKQSTIIKSKTAQASMPYESIYLCVECGINFTDPAKFRKHSCNSQQRAGRDGVFVCGYCGSSFNTADLCETHLFSHHICDICFQTFPCIQVLKIHQNVKHQISSNDLRCHQCKTSFNALVDLSKHTSSMH